MHASSESLPYNLVLAVCYSSMHKLHDYTIKFVILLSCRAFEICPPFPNKQTTDIHIYVRILNIIQKLYYNYNLDLI